MQKLFVQETSAGVTFNVFIQPRSSKNSVVGLYGDALKIKLTAPPVEGAANRMCIEFLAKQLGVAKSTLSIVSGHSGRNKRILIRNDDTIPNPREHLNALLKKI